MLLSLAVIASCPLIEHAARYLFADVEALSYNPGLALGLFSDLPEFIVVSSIGVCVGLILFTMFADMNRLTRLGFAVLSGGALSNTLERFFLGHVIDWIPSPLSFIEVNFNLADVEISIGAIVVLLSLARRSALR